LTFDQGRKEVVLKYPGSKKRIAPWIVGQFPDNYRELTYLEPFFGSGSVFFEKEPSVIETINDIDGEIVNLFKQIREHAEELIRLISLTPWSRQEYLTAFEHTDDDLEQARRFLIRAWMSRGGGGIIYKNGVRFNKKRNGSLANFCDILPVRISIAADRLLHSLSGPVQIECKDAITLIQEYDHKDVFMYLDPPYLRSTRTKNKLYKHELADDDHIRLLEAVISSKAHILISGYENGMYKEYLKGWYKDTRITLDDAGNKKVEIILRNYAHRQGYLFEEFEEAHYVTEVQMC
jgi:DNA adenine methylase